MKKTLATILLGAALMAPASAQVPGNPRTEPVDVKATDRINTQTGTGQLPREAYGQSTSGFSLPNRNFRIGTPQTGSNDVKQFPAPPAALTPDHTDIPIQRFPDRAPAAFDVKNAGDTTLDSRTSRDVKTLPAPPAANGATSGSGPIPVSELPPSQGPQVNADGESQNPSALDYSTKATVQDANSTLLPSLGGPRNNSRSTRLTPSPREVRANTATGSRPVIQEPDARGGGTQPR